MMAPGSISGFCALHVDVASVYANKLASCGCHVAAGVPPLSNASLSFRWRTVPFLVSLGLIGSPQHPEPTGGQEHVAFWLAQGCPIFHC